MCISNFVINSKFKVPQAHENALSPSNPMVLAHTDSVSIHYKWSFSNSILFYIYFLLLHLCLSSPPHPLSFLSSLLLPSPFLFHGLKSFFLTTYSFYRYCSVVSDSVSKGLFPANSLGFLCSFDVIPLIFEHLLLSGTGWCPRFTLDFFCPGFGINQGWMVV